jgi:hypothetical protein
MSLFSFLLAIDCLTAIIGSIFLVIFGQVTVRKLRKNPETKDALGIEFVSGWDIIHAGMALSLPRKFCRRAKQSPFGMLHADSDLLYKHTTKFDRILARVFYIIYAFAGLFGVILLLLDIFGFFK